MKMKDYRYFRLIEQKALSDMSFIYRIKGEEVYIWATGFDNTYGWRRCLSTIIPVGTSFAKYIIKRKTLYKEITKEQAFVEII